MSRLNAVKLLMLSLVLSLLAACSSAPLQPSPPAVVKESAIPALSSELSEPPPPSGASWNDVTQWRLDWANVLKTLQPR
jgi:hypothetical protein